MILIGRIRDSAGQHFSNGDRRGAGWRRAEKRHGGITRGREQIGGEKKEGGDNKGGWKDGKLKESRMMGRLIEEK